MYLLFNLYIVSVADVRAFFVDLFLGFDFGQNLALEFCFLRWEGTRKLSIIMYFWLRFWFKKIVLNTTEEFCEAHLYLLWILESSTV